MSETSQRVTAHKTATVTPNADANMAADVLARCAIAIASDPDLAKQLAAILPHDQFVLALTTQASERGIEVDAEARTRLGRHAAQALGCRLANWPLALRRGWQPLALEFGPCGVELVWGCGDACAEEPFHQATVSLLRSRPLNLIFAVRTPVNAAWVSSLESDALPIGGLIFHMSRCGSTLLAQALKAWPGERILSEPVLLDSALSLALSGADPNWLAFRAVLAALAQRSDTDQRVWIKLDAWHALVLPQICRQVQVPWLFLYRDPVQVMVSHAREPGLHTVRGGFDGGPFANLISPDLSPREYAAAVLGAICSAVVPHAGAEQLLNYDELPSALIQRLPRHFGLDPSMIDQARLDTVLSQHAKRPHEMFVDDRASKRAVADAALRDAAQRWIEPHYFALEAIRLQPAPIHHLQLPFECDLDALRADLAAVAPAGWAPHFNTGYYNGDWSGIALRGIPNTHVPLYADPNRSDFADTDAMQQCRYVPVLLAQLDCPIESVRFLKLAAGANIHPHRDHGLNYEQGVARLHIPVFTNPAVELVLDDVSLQLLPGECWYLNFDLTHRVANRGDSDRVHLVVDLRINAGLQARFERARELQNLQKTKMSAAAAE